jgi:hypothetical protein
MSIAILIRYRAVRPRERMKPVAVLIRLRDVRLQERIEMSIAALIR